MKLASVSLFAVNYPSLYWPLCPLNDVAPSSSMFLSFSFPL